MPRARLLVQPGARYGWLTVRTGELVARRHPYSPRSYIATECVCDCGEVRMVHTKNLRYGISTSCGCRTRFKRKTA